MHISALSRHCHDLATTLIDELRDTHPQIVEAAAHGQPLKPLIEAIGISVEITTGGGDAACSVAGSSTSTSITVVHADPARMAFTALHELGHIRAENNHPVQQRLLTLHSSRDLEEDVCDAMAALMLLPDDVVSDVLGERGRTARGLHSLVTRRYASREASCVAVAQRLEAPGYVGVVRADSGELLFAARSGDVLPLRRGLDQNLSALRPALTGTATVRDRGTLVFANGTPTQDFYLDAVRSDGIVYFVATDDRADWGAVTTGSLRPGFGDAETAYCDTCDQTFPVRRRCPVCSEAVHETCSSCSCEAPPVSRGSRPCRLCGITYGPGAYAAGSNTCSECS